MDGAEWGARPVGNGTWGASAPWGFWDEAGARGAGARCTAAQGTMARGTTTLSLQPARAAGEREGVGLWDDRRCRVLLRSNILWATSCTLERGLDEGTGRWPGALWTEERGGGLSHWGGGLGGRREEHFWCSGFL